MAKISALERLEKKIGRIISVYITNLDIFLCGSSVMYAGRFGDKKWGKHWFIVSCEEDANTPRCFRFNAIFSNDDEVEYYPPYRGFILYKHFCGKNVASVYPYTEYLSRSTQVKAKYERVLELWRNRK
jgi:hypothetical protein